MAGKLRQLLGITEAAEYLGVHPHTLRAWADKGYVDHVRMPSGHRRFDRAELDRVLADMREGKLAA